MMMMMTIVRLYSYRNEFLICHGVNGDDDNNATISRQSEIRLRNWYETNIRLGSTHQNHFITCARRKKTHTQQQQQNPMETDLSKDLYELSGAHIWQKIPCKRMAEIKYRRKKHTRDLTIRREWVLKAFLDRKASSCLYFDRAYQTTKREKKEKWRERKHEKNLEKHFEMACRRSCHWFNMPNIHFMCNMCATMSKWTRDFIVATRAHTTPCNKRRKRQRPNVSNVTSDDQNECRTLQSEGMNVKRCEQTKWIHLRLLLNYFSGSCSLCIVSGRSNVVKHKLRPYKVIKRIPLALCQIFHFSFNVKRLLFFSVVAAAAGVVVVHCSFTTPWFCVLMFVSDCIQCCCFCWFLKLIALVSVASHLIARRSFQCVFTNKIIIFFFVSLSALWRISDAICYTAKCQQWPSCADFAIKCYRINDVSSTMLKRTRQTNRKQNGLQR